MNKSKFKKLVNSQLREVSRDYLTSLKSDHKKLDNLKNDYKLQDYLSSSNLTVEEKQTLFKCRTRMIDVKSNFKIKHGQNLSCLFCTKEETQSHLLTCQEITVGVDTRAVQHDDIFKNLSKQESIAKVMNKILKQRSTKFKILSR